ncbi:MULTISPECIES: 2'-5' RNA ligase family protein [Prauserella salsuginis group]|uniref:2'-5' RNA ligase n=2 Tax=Prauserella salsuginis group TaxID=2893672 RepID=A0A839XLH2_9PSEU|nr:MULTISPECIES: 2'-5' RNA ligase family protein [Prauserella salsuginis group]MBB3662679.1 2'-5' RNA ligase [Prauserella sediminis]MCR3720377.1 2'-5' RNA ligase [Prauserella flava]MCR3733914.1 2'-5' RNA ligase [Prauserella salsuginis]
MTRSPGHSVLAVRVDRLDGYVRARTAHYDASFVSADPAFGHAHITLLAPWLADPTPSDLDVVARIAAQTPGFDTVLGRIETFPDGLIHLRCDPDLPLRTLTRSLAAAFPRCPPYGGRFGEVVPHVTLDRVADGITQETVAAELAATLPVVLRVDRIDLQWWENDNCHVRESWKLGADDRR